jgi:hypothetical protein
VEEFLITMAEVFSNMLHAFLQSAFFFWMKIFLAIYTTVLIVDVLLLAYLSDVRAQLRKLRKGAASTKTAKRSEWNEWHKIMDRLRSKDERQYRVAILEADKFVYESLELQGYGGGNFSERVSQIPVGTCSSLDPARDVHTLAKKIIHDDELRITAEQAKNALGVYESFLKNMDIL